ncbi:MAG: FMN-binding protein [Phycisphaerae bacterium]|nr:FMN-binding protein [Phycisphaerae bacterium]
MIRNLIKFVVILVVAGLVIGGGVAVLYGFFKKDIEQRDLAIKEEAIQEVCPEGATVDPERPTVGQPFAPDAVYVARDSAGRIVAYVAQGEAQGYSSVVKVMVSARAEDFSVIRVVVLAQQETPGLGATVAETRSTWTLWQKLFGSDEPEQRINTFLDQFRGKRVEEFSEIHAITAATITSNATQRAVEQALERIRQAVERTKQEAPSE